MSFFILYFRLIQTLYQFFWAYSMKVEWLMDKEKLSNVKMLYLLWLQIWLKLKLLNMLYHFDPKERLTGHLWAFSWSNSCPTKPIVRATHVWGDQKDQIDKEFKQSVVKPILKFHFKRDEFLGRINEFVYFLPFSDSELRQLVEFQLKMWKRISLEKHSIQLDWTEGWVTIF